MPRTSWPVMTARPPETDDSPAYTVMLQRPLLSPEARQRVSLGTQMALLVTGVTALTVLLVGLVLLGLVKGAAESQARDTLAGQANLAATATAERTQPVQLARALHAVVEIDQEIPPDHYKAVAEIVGYVMKLRRQVARQ